MLHQGASQGTAPTMLRFQTIYIIKFEDTGECAAAIIAEQARQDVEDDNEFF